jgi:hypothetical protein
LCRQRGRDAPATAAGTAALRTAALRLREQFGKYLLTLCEGVSHLAWYEEFFR